MTDDASRALVQVRARSRLAAWAEALRSCHRPRLNSILTWDHASALQCVCSIMRRTRLMRSQGCQRRASVKPMNHLARVAPARNGGVRRRRNAECRPSSEQPQLCSRLRRTNPIARGHDRACTIRLVFAS